MTEQLLRKKARRVLSCLDSELHKLKNKLNSLEAKRDNWAQFEQDINLTKLKPVRKNDSYADFYEGVKTIASHAHLFDHHDAQKHTIDDFKEGKTIHFKLYAAHQWNRGFHTVSLEGDYTVTSVVDNEDTSHRVYLHANVEDRNPKRVKVENDVFHYHYESTPDIELCFTQQGELSVVNGVSYDEDGTRNGTGCIAALYYECGVIYIWCKEI